MKSKAKEQFMKGEDIKIKEVPNVTLDGSDSIEDMFRNEQSATQNDVREIFGEDKVKARTDLSARQIKNITKAYYLIKLTGMTDLNRLLLDFMTLRISDSRQSRKEYIEGLKAKIENSIQQGMMNVRGQFGK
jgi:ABC-type microcin C transport system permease subunit YejB